MKDRLECSRTMHVHNRNEYTGISNPVFIIYGFETMLYLKTKTKSGPD